MNAATAPSDPVSLQASPPVPGSPIPVVLIGQAALVTGANSDIGRAVAIALGEAGADVVVNYVIDPEAVVESIRKHGSRALSIRADLSQEKAYVVKS